jgi:hypothetical protein
MDDPRWTFRIFRSVGLFFGFAFYVSHRVARRTQRAKSSERRDLRLRGEARLGFVLDCFIYLDFSRV